MWLASRHDSMLQVLTIFLGRKELAEDDADLAGRPIPRTPPSTSIALRKGAAARPTSLPRRLGVLYAVPHPCKAYRKDDLIGLCDQRSAGMVPFALGSRAPWRLQHAGEEGRGLRENRPEAVPNHRRSRRSEPVGGQGATREGQGQSGLRESELRAKRLALRPQVRFDGRSR